MRKKELIEAAVARAGVKKRDAKPAIEAALAILGETLTSGRGLNMPGLGKVKVQNSKDLDEVKVVNLRLRRKTTEGAESDEEGLAEPAE
ncbi:MAG: HU family DNA-binding protein [Shimia sp.]